MVYLDDLDGLPVHPSFNASMPQCLREVWMSTTGEKDGTCRNWMGLYAGILDGIL